MTEQMTEYEVTERLEKGEDPLNLEIEMWTRLTKWIRENDKCDVIEEIKYGGMESALCEIAEGNCDDCVIGKHDVRCEIGLWKKFNESIKNWEVGIDSKEDVLKAASDMVALLERIKAECNKE